MTIICIFNPGRLSLRVQEKATRAGLVSQELCDSSLEAERQEVVLGRQARQQRHPSQHNLGTFLPKERSCDWPSLSPEGALGGPPHAWGHPVCPRLPLHKPPQRSDPGGSHVLWTKEHKPRVLAVVGI